MYENNAFITLTYDDEHLKSDRLILEDFQKFAKRLRENAIDPQTGDQPKIPIMYTGEYGEKNKRPHWHAIIFNWLPPALYRMPDGTTKPDGYGHRTSDRGDQTWQSLLLDDLWMQGKSEIGGVTIQSAGYVARYATKKLVHGIDHEFQPIHRMSSKYAIGKRWLEQHWPDVFRHGHVVLLDGSKAPIPRYYEKWLKEHRPNDWLAYVTRVKLDRQLHAETREKTEEEKWWAVYNARRLTSKTPLRRNEVRRLIKQKQFEQLQAYLKL